MLRVMFRFGLWNRVKAVLYRRVTGLQTNLPVGWEMDAIVRLATLYTLSADQHLKSGQSAGKIQAERGSVTSLSVG